jgi:hypothetical protein
MFRLAQAAVAEAEPRPRRASPICQSYAWTVGVPNSGPLGGENFLSLRTVRASHPPAARGPGHCEMLFRRSKKIQST